MNSLDVGILLCAGLGVRLRPLTEVRPKPLLHFFDRPIASWGLEALIEGGVTTIGANAHHLPESVVDWLRADVDRYRAEGAGQIRAEVVVERELLGTGAGALGVWKQLGSPRQTTAVINGDVVADFPLEQMMKVHRRTGAVATMLAIPQLSGEGAVGLDEKRHFIARLPLLDDVADSPRYEARHAVSFGGVYILEPEVFDRLPNTNSCLIRRGLAPMLAEGAVIAVYEHDGFWADLGTARRYLDAGRAVLDHPDALPGLLPEREHRKWVADHRTVHPGATLNGPVYIASGALVEAGATVGPYAIIGADCVVRSGAEVTDCVAMCGAELRGRVTGQLVAGPRSLRAV